MQNAALLTALAHLSLVPASLAGLSGSTAPGQGSSTHPAEALVYFELPDVQKLFGAYEGAPLWQLLTDDDVSQTFGMLTGQQRFDVAAMISAALDQSPPGAEGGTYRWLAGAITGLSFSHTVKDTSLAEVIAETERFAAAAEGLDMVWGAVEHFRSETGAWPAALEDVDGLTGIVDPWGSPYVYEPAADGSTARLLSLSHDRAAGGVGSAADLDFGTDLERRIEALLLERQALQLELTFADETARERFLGLALGGLGATLQREPPSASTEGISVGRLEGPELEVLQVVERGNTLAILVGEEAVAGYLARVAGDAPALGLAWRAGAESFSEGKGATLFEGFSGLGGPKGLGAYLEPARPAVDLLSGLLGPSVAMLLAGGHWRVQLRGEQFVSEGLVPRAAGQGVLGAEPLGSNALSFMHPEAVTGFVANFDGAALADALAMHAGPLAREHGFEGVLELANKLARALGGTLAVSLPSPRSLVSAPDAHVAFELTDHDGFMAGLEQLEALLSELELPIGNLSLARSAYRSAEIFTLTASGLGPIGDLPIDVSTLVRPTVAVLPDRVIFTPLPNHAKREVRRLARAGEMEVHPLLGALEVPEGVTQVGFADWPSLLGRLYESGKALGSMMALGGELPFDPSELPDAEVFLRFFKPSTRFAQKLQDGAFYHYAESSFGPELVVLPAALAALLPVSGGFAKASPPAVPTPIARANTVEELSRANLSLIEAAISVYRLDRGELPPDLDALMRPSEAFPEGYLEGAALPLDGYGRPFIYERAEGGYRLRSKGADGEDQSGAGDDLEP